MVDKIDIERRFVAYRNNLKLATRFLSTNNDVIKYCGDMQASCAVLTDLLSIGGNKSKNWKAGISPTWKIPVTNPIICGAKGNIDLAIAGVTRVENNMLDQSISVSIILTPAQDQPSHNNYNCGNLTKDIPIVLRRFHFDYDTTIPTNDRPRSHLQYGGKCEHDILSIENIKYYLFSSLEFPRLPLPPMDLIMVFDIFIQQFPTPLNALHQDLQWISFVKESERLWAKGYYSELSNYLHLADRNSLYKRQCDRVDWYT